MALLLVTGSQGHVRAEPRPSHCTCEKQKGGLASSFWWEVSLAFSKQSYLRLSELFIQRLTL